MRILKISFLILLVSSAAISQPVITPTNFLNTLEPQRMCQDYIDQEFGSGNMLTIQPSGGASIRISKGSSTKYLYIFCDSPFNRLNIFTISEQDGFRWPDGRIRAYGIDFVPIQFTVSGNARTFSVPYQGQADKEHFLQPVDIAVSSKGKNYDPAIDFIYVLDQGNSRIVKLRYDVSLDSLIWVDSFGSDVLELPTAIDYADYNDDDPDNDDIFVVDGILAKIFRFSRHGFLESTYGGWGSAFGGIYYPTGIAVSASGSFTNIIYVTDSRAHRVLRMMSLPNGPIYPELWHEFPLDTQRYVKAVDTDSYGNVYVIDDFAHEVLILTPDLSTILATLEGKGSESRMIYYPFDIYIDGSEIIICEKWGPRTGIRTFNIQTDKPVSEEPEIPYSFFLYQNYPNPFNSTTTIEFQLPSENLTLLEVYNMLGQKVTVLSESRLPAGPHKIIWDGRNSRGQPVASGVYIYLIVSGDMRSSRKMVLLK